MSTMPRDLILVRHGESEGNKAKSLWKKGKKDPFTKDFLNRHSSEFRLTDRGRRQAIVTGEWIRKNIGETFDFYATSEYVRAMETAGLLGLPNALWHRDIDLRERDHGFADLLHPDHRSREYGEQLERYKKNQLIYPVPGGGESIAHMRFRSWRIFTRLRRRVPEGRAILVCHGEFMWGIRMDIEHIKMDKFIKLHNSKKPFDKIHNCQVIHYTRVNPYTGELKDYYGWMKSTCPSAPELSLNEWVPIVRKKFTNDELLREVKKHRRRIS